LSYLLSIAEGGVERESWRKSNEDVAMEDESLNRSRVVGVGQRSERIDTHRN
jgi:hypothetical protein